LTGGRAEEGHFDEDGRAAVANFLEITESDDE